MLFDNHDSLSYWSSRQHVHPYLLGPLAGYLASSLVVRSTLPSTRSSGILPQGEAYPISSTVFVTIRAPRVSLQLKLTLFAGNFDYQLHWRRSRLYQASHYSRRRQVYAKHESIKQGTRSRFVSVAPCHRSHRLDPPVASRHPRQPARFRGLFLSSITHGWKTVLWSGGKYISLLSS